MMNGNITVYLIEMKEKGVIMAHGSSQVYQFINNLEGHPLDTINIWDVVNWQKDGIGKSIVVIKTVRL